MTLLVSVLLATASFSTGPEPEVKVETLGGEVRVTAQPQNLEKVELASSLEQGEPPGTARWRVETRHAGDQLVVRLTCGRGAPPSGCGGEPKAKLKLRVPERTKLKATATSAQVSVVGVKGPIVVETVTGGVATEGSADDLRLGTVSGDIAIAPEQVQESRIVTDTGNVHLKLPAGSGADVRFSTVSGSLNGQRLDAGTRAEQMGSGGPRVEVQTVSGSLKLLAAPKGSR